MYTDNFESANFSLRTRFPSARIRRKFAIVSAFDNTIRKTRSSKNATLFKYILDILRYGQ